MANGKPGAPLGSKNATKNKPFEDAIRRALARRQAGGSIEPLVQIADKLIDAAIEGDRTAQVELANRLDGKAKQQLDVNTNALSNLADNIRNGRARAKNR